MAKKNRVAFPGVGDGYAQNIMSASKEHKCRKCGCIIEKKTSYISVHTIDPTTTLWSSYALCEKCHEELTKNTKPADPIASRIQAAYYATDGTQFYTFDGAVKYEKALDDDRSVYMYTPDGNRTHCVLDAKVIYVVNDAGVKALIRRIGSMETKMNRNIRNLFDSTIKSGVYVWIDSLNKYVHMYTDTVKAFCSLHAAITKEKEENSN